MYMALNIFYMVLQAHPRFYSLDIIIHTGATAVLFNLVQFDAKLNIVLFDNVSTRSMIPCIPFVLQRQTVILQITATLRLDVRDQRPRSDVRIWHVAQFALCCLRSPLLLNIAQTFEFFQLDWTIEDDHLEYLPMRRKETDTLTKSWASLKLSSIGQVISRILILYQTTSQAMANYNPGLSEHDIGLARNLISFNIQLFMTLPFSLFPSAVYYFVYVLKSWSLTDFERAPFFQSVLQNHSTLWVVYMACTTTRSMPTSQTQLNQCSN